MQNNLGTLYICPTPIGNLEDITLRVLRILKEVNFIIAEDTRITQKLLNHYEIKTKLISYHKYSDKEKTDLIITELLDGKNIALVSDSGTPIISDPGYDIVREARENNIQIIPLPGPSALSCAISASELITNGFCFYGFLPKEPSKIKKIIKQLSQQRLPIVLFESPQRVVATLELILEILGDINVTISRELSKIHEEIFTEKIQNVIDKLKQRENKGEFTIIIDKIVTDDNVLSDDDLIEIIKEKLKLNQSVSSIAKELSASLDCNKNHIYKLALDLSQKEF